MSVRPGMLALVACVAMVAVGGSASADEDRGLVFFAFDDQAIPWHHNTQTTLVQAEKHPANPVLRSGPPGSADHGHAVLYGSVLRIGGKFRMWYLGMIETELKSGQAPGWWRPMCYAESTDGVHWTKPELGLVELNGNKKNNICLIESDPYSLSRVNDYLTVIYEPNDPDPARRYKAAYIAHVPFDEVQGGRSKIGPNEKRWGAFIGATSADGLKWRVVGDRPMNAGGERFEVAGLYRFGDFYYASGQLLSPWTWLRDGREVGRQMLTYRSSDFQHWSRATAQAFVRPGQMIAEPAPGQQTHMGAGIWNRGNVLVGLYGMWQDGPKERPKGSSHLHGMRIDLGLIVSDDGVHFREPVPDFKVIPHGKGADWDSVSLLQAHAFANVDDKTYLWYSHWDNEGEFRHQEIGLATLRRDGFGYLSRKVAEQDGQCITTTIPALEKGYRLRLNVAGVSRDAPLTVELVDKLGRPLADYSGKNAAKLTEPGVGQDVVFPSGAGSSPKGEPFAVQVGFPASGDAKLYAIYAEPTAEAGK